MPAATTTYTVTGTGANGCTASANVTVTVNPLPVVTVSGATSAWATSQRLQVHRGSDAHHRSFSEAAYPVNAPVVPGAEWLLAFSDGGAPFGAAEEDATGEETTEE